VTNQEARLTLGAFQTTNQGALSLESGLRPAPAQLDNRLRRFALRLASLPGGDQARELVGAPDSMLGQRLQSSLRCWNGREETVPLEVATPLETTTTTEEAAAMREAQLSGRDLHRRLPPGEWRNWLRGRLEEGRYLETPDGLGPGSLRRRMRKNCNGHQGIEGNEVADE